ncbi:MAG: hypothetical protein M1822_005171 [Bathelium mastoideum]|nr:MAG: hypothetical protein M1822_005171 [Bathelium mastoideum]
MADLKVEAVEPDPSATSLPNDQTVNEKLANTAEPAKEHAATPEEDVAKAQEPKKANGAEKEEKNTEEAKSRDKHADSDDRKNYHKKRNDGQWVRRDNNKFDPSTLPETDDPDEIRKQVEFYFSDSNLPLDKFLFSQVGGTENKPFPISQLCTFKRMKRFQPFSAVVAALKESEVLDVTENDEVRRKVPLDSSLGNQDDNLKILEDEAMPRSIYAKGFGEESADTQFAIEAFFAPYGPTRAIRLRRHPDRAFKGSAFVEFETEEAAKQFLELDPKPKFHQKPLVIKSKKEYCEQKVADIKSGRLASKNNKAKYQRNDRSRGGKFQNRNGRDNNKRYRDSHGHGYRRGEDDRDWRTRRDEDNKKKQERAEKTTRDDAESEDNGKTTSGKKRGRDEEDGTEVASPKKAKVEEEKVEKEGEPVDTTVEERNDAAVTGGVVEREKAVGDLESTNDAAAEGAASEANPKLSTTKKRARDEGDGEDGQEKTGKKAKGDEAETVV